jgi:hypothetical protein
MKTLSIVGIVIASITVLCCISCNNIFQYESGLSWGIIGGLYLLAISIVILIKKQ